VIAFVELAERFSVSLPVCDPHFQRLILSSQFYGEFYPVPPLFSQSQYANDHVFSSPGSTVIFVGHGCIHGCGPACLPFIF
jgi:hypothetical protein